MKAQQCTPPNSATSPANHQAGLVTWIRSMSYVDMIRAGTIILSQAFVLASIFFDR